MTLNGDGRSQAVANRPKAVGEALRESNPLQLPRLIDVQ